MSKSILMTKEELRGILSNNVSPMVGFRIDPDDIHNDADGWYYYIPRYSLKRNHPLIMRHYRGPIFMVIPTEDWHDLESGNIRIAEYVKNSQWSYGWYWAGGTLLYGVFWQPLEEKGIHDTERIARYLEILGCRTCNRSSGHVPTEKECKDCWVEHCPYSPFSKEDEKASWENEVQEKDARKELLRLVSERLEKQFGFKVESCFPHGEKEGIWIFPGFKKDTVSVYLPQDVLIDLLYDPEQYNLSELVESWSIDVCVPWHYENYKFVGAVRKPVERGKESKMFAYDVWATHCPGKIREWGLADLVPAPAKKQKKKKSLIDRLLNKASAS